MKTLLLPTDFSENSLKAISYARRLYQGEACSFLLLHAYKVNGYDETSRLIPIPGRAAMEEAESGINGRLREIIGQLRMESKVPNHEFKFLAVNKSLVEAVKDVFTKYPVDLVVIGTQGHTGSSEVVYGSNTLNLMEEVQRCPILAVPAHISFHSVEEVVLANNYKTELSPQDFYFLVEFSRKQKAAIRVLHIQEEGGLTPKQKMNRKKFQEQLEEQQVNFSFHSLEFLSIPLGIYSFIESRGSDMIAIVNKKHSLLEILLLDPLYKNLAHYSKVPVLVLHQP